ncbi:MAG: hypothetical protein KatS3mg032_0869 [Cyclobacteriaceae bacterium]|nr:MAG: hypothetical protein KatS3mg032_0869 [Cyclobacteriaceae bacterium]
MKRIKFNLDAKGVRVWLYIIGYFTLMVWVAIQLPKIMS